MGKYQGYPEYEDSKVQWLPDLPQHWGIERIKRMLRLKRTLVGKKSSEYQLLSLTLKGIITRDISTGEGKIPESFDTYQEVEKNDLVFCLFDMDETPRTVGLSALDGMITGAYNVYGCLDKCYPAYASYYFLHIDKFKGLRPFYTGLRKVVRSETFDNIEIPCPPYEEQTQIANFLDHETAKIDTLIEKQQQLIKLLKEKRQAVISHAVTKGLNPQAPMKNSGVEWLGKVPEHWEVTRIKYLADLTPSKDEVKDNLNSECSFVPMEKLKTDSLKLDEVRLVGDVVGGYTYFKNGDILLAKVTPCFENKNMAIAQDLKNGIGFGSSEIYVLRPKQKALTEYIYYRLQEDTFIDLATGEMTGAGGLKRVPSDFLTNFKVALPDPTECSEIVMYIKHWTKKYDQLISAALVQVRLMQERRTALISAAVTGKIDVRNWQAPTSQDQALEQTANAASKEAIL